MAIKLTNKQIVEQLDDLQLIAVAEKFSMGLDAQLPREKANEHVIKFAKDNDIDLSGVIKDADKKAEELAKKEQEKKAAKSAALKPTAEKGQTLVYLKNAIKFRGERHDAGEYIAVNESEKNYLKRLKVLGRPPEEEEEIYEEPVK